MNGGHSSPVAVAGSGRATGVGTDAAANGGTCACSCCSDAAGVESVMAFAAVHIVQKVSQGLQKSDYCDVIIKSTN